MAKRKKTKRRRAGKVIIADAATKETRAKLKRDPVQELAYRNKIAPVHEQAAREINAVFTARTCSLWAKAQNLTRIGGGRPDMEWPSSLKAAARRYDAWANTLSREHHNGAPPLLYVAIDMVVDGRSGNEVDTERKQRKGTASDWLVRALKRYVKEAGWADPLPETQEGRAA